jgi:hypothetical protein
LTPPAFSALCDRRALERREALIRAGQITAAIYNVVSSRSEPFTPADIFPELKEASGEQSIEEQIQVLTEVMGCGPGRLSQGTNAASASHTPASLASVSGSTGTRSVE